ncbi:chaperonin Cpn60/TCP-1 family, partial [Kipferlia bialata]|eukprot:g13701.t1
MKAVKYTTAGGVTKYPVRAINILKAFGQSSADSKLIDGFALNCVRATEAMPESVHGAKIALIDFNLQQERLAVGTQILIKDPKKLEEVKAREFDITKERIRLILDSGANCIFTTGGIDDMAQKYLVEQGVLGIRRCDKDDLQRIARMTGGAILSTLADLEGEEKFDEEALGHAESVVEERVADSKLTFIRGTAERSCGSIVLRGPNSQMLDEVDRSVHDALCAVSKTLESGKMVAGGGAVESALSVYLERHAATLEGREQMAVKAFAKALLAIP